MRPNILFITTHDLGKHLGCYGQQTVTTPNLDALAGLGVRFDAHYCTAPQCSPSRATLHTGRYAHATGMLGLAHEPFNWQLHATERHMAQRLHDLGYRTALVGIQHVAPHPFQLADPAALGYDVAYPATPAHEMRQQVVQVLAEMAQDERPFYLEVGFFEPHRPYDWGAPPTDDSLGTSIPHYLPDSSAARTEFAQLQGMIRRMDQAIGYILGALDATGQRDNTLIVFTTDHGLAMPRAKCTCYDPGLEVALLMHWPAGNLTGGRGISALTSHVDVAPTLLALLNEAIPPEMHGVSLLPLIHAEAENVRDAVYAEKTYHTAYEPMRAMRTTSHKLIVNFAEDVAVNVPADIQNSPIYPSMIPQTSMQRPDFELYDLQADPLEQDNCAHDPAHEETRQVLLTRLHTWMQATNDPLLQGVPASPHHRRMMDLLSGAAYRGSSQDNVD